MYCWMADADEDEDEDEEVPTGSYFYTFTFIWDEIDCLSDYMHKKREVTPTTTKQQPLKQLLYYVCRSDLWRWCVRYNNNIIY